jgi:hypothetical protein
MQANVNTLPDSSGTLHRSVLKTKEPGNCRAPISLVVKYQLSIAVVTVVTDILSWLAIRRHRTGHDGRALVNNRWLGVHNRRTVVNGRRTGRAVNQAAHDTGNDSATDPPW